MAMFPSECVLDHHVRTDYNYFGDQDLDAPPNLPFFILKCEHRKADGYANNHELELHNQRLQHMLVGVRLADKPPALSSLAILGTYALANVVAVDTTVVVISLRFLYKEDGDEDPTMSYLIYDAVALSLRLIPQQQEDQNPYTLCPRVSIARRYHGHGGGDYALVHTDTGNLAQDYEAGLGENEDASLFLWRPSSSSAASLPWSEKKKFIFPDASFYNDAEITHFSFNGHAYWVDLERGVSYCSCDALLDDTTSVVEIGGFIHLPDEFLGYRRSSQLEVHRDMGVVCGSFIRLVSVDGLRNEKRIVTVWRLLGHDEGWEKEHEFSMAALWGYEGFGKLSKKLAPIYPFLSTVDTDVVYLALGKYRNLRGREFSAFGLGARYLLAVDMRKKMVTSVRLGKYSDPEEFVSCRFSRNALVGPCDDQGVPIPMVMENKKKQRRRNLAAEASIDMKMEPRVNKHIRCS